MKILKLIPFFVILFISGCSAKHEQIEIIEKPIIFNDERVKLTKEYFKDHYKIEKDDIKIVPQMIVLHWTAIDSFEKSFKRFEQVHLFSDRTDISKAGLLNVSAHFLIDKEGRIFRLMDETTMARHVIGLNHCAIGIENVASGRADLTKAQINSNRKLVRYLKKRYKTIEYLIGHHEYTEFEESELFKEIDNGYRTEKDDPGDWFMKEVYEGVKDLRLRREEH